MQLQKCTIEDVTKLALLNKQLIEDEKSDNVTSINELARRMKGFLETEYSAFFLLRIVKSLDMHSLEIQAIQSFYVNFL